jgi:hypothetical protein
MSELQTETPRENENSDLARMVRLLAEYGANLDTVYRGRDAIHFAVENENLPALRYLVSVGVEYNSIDLTGKRPIHITAMGGFETAVDILLEQPNSEDTIEEPCNMFGTPLHCASRDGYTAIIRKLLDAGGSLDLMALLGNTTGPALYSTCAEGEDDVIGILLSHGADPNVQGLRYKSAEAITEAFGKL